ncbi:MAG: hypothetical protein HN337_02745 [Deltaproteobacteria bacterium]|nr:hypothetical protein [Deltaproteobacteria bacterium]
MFRSFSIALILISIAFASCAKPLIDSREYTDGRRWSRDYAASANEVYYAIRWALNEHDYPISSENLHQGLVTTTWVPVKSDSHCVWLFEKCDYGVINSYYQLDIYVHTGSGRTLVKIGSRLKGLVENQVSTGREEKKVLASIGDFLRKSPPDISNVGISE